MKKNRFAENLVRLNYLDEKGFEIWLFSPGMLFNAKEKWWGDMRERPAPHEGTDFCFYRNIRGERIRLDQETRIPGMYDGRVVKIVKDFLGESVYIRHDIPDGSGNRLYTLFGHTRPSIYIHTGALVREGEIFATLSDTSNKKTGVLPHLHISVAWISESCIPEKLNWTVISEQKEMMLLDPLEIIGCEYVCSQAPFLPEEHYHQ